MKVTLAVSLSLFAVAAAGAQPADVQAERLAASTTIPVVFTKGVDANHAHVGDAVIARTTQNILTASGRVIPAGAQVVGHVVAGAGFAYDPTPYAKQKEAELAIHFDRIESRGMQVPVTVYVRAMASPISSWDAVKPRPSDEDPDATTTQIGGDLVTPSRNEVRTQEDDVVGYKRRDGVHAHLIAAQGNSTAGCDATDTEQAMNIFSASACGLYGFADTRLSASGRTGTTGTFVLESHKQAPKIYAHSNALLEITAEDARVASR